MKDLFTMDNPPKRIVKIDPKGFGRFYGKVEDGEILDLVRSKLCGDFCVVTFYENEQGKIETLELPLRTLSNRYLLPASVRCKK